MKTADQRSSSERNHLRVILVQDACSIYIRLWLISYQLLVPTSACDCLQQVNSITIYYATSVIMLIHFDMYTQLIYTKQRVHNCINCYKHCILLRFHYVWHGLTPRLIRTQSSYLYVSQKQSRSVHLRSILMCHLFLCASSQNLRFIFS